MRLESIMKKEILIADNIDNIYEERRIKVFNLIMKCRDRREL